MTFIAADIASKNARSNIKGKELDLAPLDLDLLKGNTGHIFNNSATDEKPRNLEEQLAIDEAMGVDGNLDSEKRFSEEQEALIDMAKNDKKTGISKEDMEAYKDLNKELGDKGFPEDAVRGPETHPKRKYKEPHGHVGPIDHIPVK